VLLLQNMFKPARKIVSEWYKIGKVFASVERIQDLLDREVVVQDLPDAEPAPPLEGRLSFRDVSFAYPVEHEDGTRADGRPKVLDRISFEVDPGEVVALVGFSGAGKSTIAQLVPRLYDPDEGEVLVDGHPVRGLTLASLRGQVSLVLQETVLLSGTVAENIGYGVANATREDIEAASHMANAHGFIMELPDGYETMLGERGATLSGGQRQRIAIARAFIRRAPILILDEPTTGLDVDSAQSVVSALRSLMRGTTTIVISHDPGLIRSADRVLVISDGRIVEEGVHRVLVRSGGPYAELYARDASPAAALGTDGELPRKPAWSLPDSSGSPETPDLLGPLRGRLPGLAKALDDGYVAEQIERMLGREAVIDLVSVGKLWLRDDGSCNLRYRVRLADVWTSVGETTVLGRVHPGQGSAETHLAKLQGRLDRLVARRSTALVPEAALRLSRFPVDPDLPSLPAATDPHTMSRLQPFADCDGPPTITVVHHPREGACVLRYRRRRSSEHSPGRPTPFLYGKVYGDRTGHVVDGFLRALAKERRDHDVEYPVAFPAPVLYEPTLRLLLTEVLPGEPIVPRLLKRILARARTYSADDLTRLESAVHASGRALAALHGSDLATAPVRPATEELADVRRELEVVARVWPDVADRIRERIEVLARQVLDVPTMVLSHGDFTPSQVLLGEGPPAVVDLDTLCWADPALDVGRYLAYLHLLAVKAGGESAADLVDDLAGNFLDGYALAGARTSEAAEAADRIAFYKSTTLVRIALHSCRQLKTSRYELAMSTLGDLRVGRADP
jgi:ABC-type glutathione transport system ATPase component